MSKGTHATLVRFANQIAKNFAAIGEDKAVSATLDHIEKFWDPRMKAAILAGDCSDLDPIAAKAVARLALDGPPDQKQNSTNAG